MSKAKEIRFHEGGLYGYEHLCPGCSAPDHTGRHAIPTSGNDPWTFNDDVERPTFSPSVLHTTEFGDGTPKSVCHYFIIDGSIQFCADSTHALAGQTVPLPELP